MVFEIEGKEIEVLEPSPFVSFLNHLLSTECSKLGIPPTQVKTSSQIMSAEGGIDGSIEDQNKQTDKRWIPPGLSVWQFRTGKTKTRPKQLAEEAVKPAVLHALKSGGYYVVAISQRCDHQMRRRREAAIRKALQKKKVNSTRFALLTADDLARWGSEYLSVFLLFNRPIGKSMRLEDWEQFGKDGPFVANEDRKTIINEIHKFISQRGSPVDFRILGRRGIGKTRLVLEALGDVRTRERVVYAQDPSCLPDDIWAWIRGNKNISAILVVDECEEDVSSKLRDQALTCGGLIRLVTIGIGEWFLPEALPNHVFLERLDPGSIRAVLKARFAALSLEQIDWIERVTAGYVKLAVACGETIVRNPSFDVTKLANSPGIREFLKDLLPDDKVRTGMQSLSLLTQVGFEGEVEAEGRVLAGFSGLSWDEFKDVAERMYQKGLVGKKGRFRYVTPDLLADWLAGDLRQTRSTDIRDFLDRLPSQGSKEAFFERLKELGGNEQAREEFFRMISEQELPTIEDLDTENGSKILYTVALADPQLALRALERLIGNASIDRLRSFTRGRRNVIWALDYLKWFKDAFFGAAKLLLALAEAETEKWSNNASGTWVGLFRLRLGGTEVPAIDRITILDETLANGSTARRVLALDAMAVAMSSNEVRSSGVEKDGSKPVPPEWHPRTFGEIWAVYRKMLQLVDRTMLDHDPVISKEARKTLINSARTLVTVGLAEEIVGRLEKLEPQDYAERREFRDSVRTILEYEKENLRGDQRERLIALERKLAGTTYQDRLRRWIGQWSFGDWNIQKSEGGLPPQGRVAELAEEAMKDPDELRSELDWLVSDEASNAGYFGKRLGELDHDGVWLEELITKSRGHRPILLGTYLGGRNAIGDEEIVAVLLDQWAKNDEQLAGVVLFATLNVESSKRNLDRIVNLVQKGWIQRKDLVILVWSGWGEKLPQNSLGDFLTCLLDDENKDTTEAALDLLDRRLKSSPNDAEILAPFAWQLLARKSAFEGTMGHYYWGEVSKHFVQVDPLKVADIVLGLYREPKVLFHKNDEPLKTLAKATESRPEEVWDRVADVLLRKDEAGYRLLLGLKDWYVGLRKSEELLAWAEKHKPDGPQILATLTLPGGIPLNELTRQLLIRYGRNERLANRLYANLQSGAFTGSMTDWLRSRLANARAWTADSDPTVRGWAQRLVENLEEQIRGWEEREQEEDLT